MMATSTTFLGLPLWHDRVQKARMAELWRMMVTVTMYNIVRTEARPSQTLHQP